VALDAPDGLFLDITGVDHLWGGEGAMADDLAARLAANGIPARTAIASTAGAAWALAHFAQDHTLAAPDATMAHLARLPIQALRLEDATAAQIARLGLITIGRLAGTPRDQITRRFGAGVVLRLDQALGRVEEALLFRRPRNPWFTRLAFAEPISTPDDLARVAGDITAAMCARLEAEGRGARRFELCFHRLDGLAQRIAIGLSLPGRQAARIARLFLPHLETIDPGFGIEVATLTAESVEAIGARQQTLDARAEIAPEDGLAPLVDRLVNRLGAKAVWRAEPWPSHLPERSVIRRAPLSAASGEGWDPARPRPVRLFRRPEPIEAMAPIPDDPPLSFRWRGAHHRVRRAEGPERLAPEWWRSPRARIRDYYRVEDDTGARFWLFRAGLYGEDPLPKWWLHGLFG
jgi:protein ImuB